MWEGQLWTWFPGVQMNIKLINYVFPSTKVSPASGEAGSLPKVTLK